MAGPVSKVSVILNGGIDEQGASELSGPIASQGGSLVLRRSQNTRLSPLRGTCARPPACPSEKQYGNRIHGVIPCEAGQNSLVFLESQVHRMLGPNGEGSSSLGEGPLVAQTTDNAHTPASAYLPARISASGGCPGEPGYGEVTSAYDSTTGFLYHAYGVYSASSLLDIVVYVTGIDGSIIATPRRVITGRLAASLALTAHGEHGVRLWLCEGGATLEMVSLTYTANNDIVPFWRTVALDGSSLPFAVCSGEIINSDGSADGSYADFAYVTTASGADGLVSKVNVNTGVLTSATVTGAAEFHSAIAFDTTGLGYRVAAVFQTGTAVETRIYDFNLALQNSATTAIAGNKVACQFLRNPSDANTHVLVLQEATLADGSEGIEVISQVSSSNVATVQEPLPWMRLRSAGAQATLSQLAAFPVFDLMRYYGADNLTLVSPDYVPDPDVQLWMFRSPTLRVPVARYGSVRGSAAPASMRPAGDHRTILSLTNFGTGVFGTYTKLILEATTTTPRTSRWVTISFPGEQPSLAFDRDGVTLASGALPVEWDGVLLTEMGGPLYAPHITVEEDLAGSAWPAGDYIVAAIYEFTDAGGRLHRSMATAAEFTSTGFGPEVFVTCPTATTRDGAYDVDVDCILYASSVTDSNLRRVPYEGVRSEGGWTFSSVNQPGDSAALIYSTGEGNQEQMPQPPPALFDVEIVADRAWGIDGEYRSRIVHSKRRVSGIGFEWHPGYEIHLPSGSGPAMAIREWMGSVVVFAEYGIFGISGDGPDNLVGNPSGGSFSKPQKIADLGTTNARSVVSTPAGIVFQRDEDMMLFTGGSPKTMVGPKCDELCQAAIVLRDQDEVVFFFASGQKVWNYGLDRWTTWQLVDAGTETTGDFHIAVELPYAKTKALVVSNTEEPDIHLLDSDVTGSLAMSWETDWILLGGDFQDHVNLQHLVFSARRLGAHGVTIEVFTGYNETTPSTTRTWTAGEITTLAAVTAGRYTLKLQPTNRGTRAAKIRLTETTPTGEGMRPISLTLYHTVEAGLMEAEIRPGAFR